MSLNNVEVVREDNVPYVITGSYNSLNFPFNKQIPPVQLVLPKDLTDNEDGVWFPYFNELYRSEFGPINVEIGLYPFLTARESTYLVLKALISNHIEGLDNLTLRDFGISRTFKVQENSKELEVPVFNLSSNVA